MTRRIQPDEIIAAAEWHCGCPIAIAGQPATKRRIRVRQMAAEVMHRHLEMDSTEIGAIFGIHASGIRNGWNRNPVGENEYDSVLHHAYSTLVKREAELALAERIEREARVWAATPHMIGMTSPQMATVEGIVPVTYNSTQ